MAAAGPPTVPNQVHVAVVRSITGMFKVFPRSFNVCGMSIAAVVSCPAHPPFAREIGVTNIGVAPAALASFAMPVMLLSKFALLVVLSLWPISSKTQSPGFNRDLIAPHRLALRLKLTELSPESAQLATEIG